MTERQCNDCGKNKTAASFSTNQWKGKGGKRRCKDCVSGTTIEEEQLASDIRGALEPAFVAEARGELEALKVAGVLGADARVITDDEAPRGIAGPMPPLCNAVRPMVGGLITPFIADILLHCANWSQLRTGKESSIFNETERKRYP